jgi:hypothetical protein
MSKAKSFIEYALSGWYIQERKKSGNHLKFFEISKANLVKVLSMSRLGSNQREELQETCIRLNIAMVELSDRFIFFDPDELDQENRYLMNAKVGQLKKITDEYDRLKRSEADRAFERQFEPAEA